MDFWVPAGMSVVILTSLNAGGEIALLRATVEQLAQWAYWVAISTCTSDNAML